MSNNMPFTPRYETPAPMLLAGVKKTYTFAGRGGIADHWRDFSARLGDVEGRIGAAAYGVVTDPSGAGDFDYMTAVEIEEGAAPAGLERVQVDADRFAVFRHDGPIVSLAETMGAIHRDFLPEVKDRVVVGIIERYGESFNPATGEGGFDIIVPLKD